MSRHLGRPGWSCWACTLRSPIRLVATHRSVCSCNLKDVFWDIVASMDASEQVPDGPGWHNAWFIPEAQRLHPTREVCCRADGFENLLEWFKDELAPATHLALYGEEDGWTSAHLARDGMLLRGNYHPNKARCDMLQSVLNPDPIDVTPQMIDAGVERLTALVGQTGSAYVVTEVFRAMERSRVDRQPE